MSSKQAKSLEPAQGTNGAQFHVSFSPHIRGDVSIARIMWTVVICLLPAGAMGVYAHGLRALWIIILCVFTAVVAEIICQKVRGVAVTISDGSAVLTGLLFAYVISACVPWYVAVVGTLFAIVVAKHFFGGLGNNIWNPALAGRAFALAAFSTWMTAVWPAPQDIPRWSAQPVSLTAATPLGCIRKAKRQSLKLATQAACDQHRRAALGANAAQTWSRIRQEETTNYLDLAVGTVSGCIGETSAVLLLLGGLVLCWLGFINWYLPLTIMGSIALLGWILPVQVGWYDPVSGKTGVGWVWLAGDPLFHLLAGGTVIGAVFMATDMVTSPITASGQIIFGLGIGLLTVLIRNYGGYPEGMSYAILIMNTAVPLIDRYTQPRVFGAR